MERGSDAGVDTDSDSDWMAEANWNDDSDSNAMGEDMEGFLPMDWDCEMGLCCVSRQEAPHLRPFNETGARTCTTRHSEPKYNQVIHLPWDMIRKLHDISSNTWTHYTFCAERSVSYWRTPHSLKYMNLRGLWGRNDVRCCWEVSGYTTMFYNLLRKCWKRFLKNTLLLKFRVVQTSNTNCSIFVNDP